MKSLTDTFQLRNKVEIPCIGYGTWKTPDGETASVSVKTAIELGYRHIDTAAAYGNETSVGEGIRESGISREQLFVTSKVWNTERGYEKTLHAFEKTCQECVTEDIYRVKGIRVWVPAQATRQGRADIGTALLFLAVLPAVYDTRGRQGGGVSPARPVSFPRLRRGASLSLPKKSFGISLRSESHIEF